MKSKLAFILGVMPLEIQVVLGKQEVVGMVRLVKQVLVMEMLVMIMELVVILRGKKVPVI